MHIPNIILSLPDKQTTNMKTYNDLFTRQQILDFAFTELDADSIQSYMQVFSTLDDQEFSTTISRDFGFRIQNLSRNAFTIIY